MEGVSHSAAGALPLRPGCWEIESRTDRRHTPDWMFFVEINETVSWIMRGWSVLLFGKDSQCVSKDDEDAPTPAAPAPHHGYAPPAPTQTVAARRARGGG